jgi:tRNA 2-thiouridine synthesizing protein A
MTSELDTTGLKCPLPVLRAKKRLKDIDAGAVMRVLATDPDAVADFEAFCAETGHTFVDWSKDGDVLTITIQKSGQKSG